jgi:hypothetical protein
VPSNGNEIVNTTLTIEGGTFMKPVWGDLLTGGLYDIPQGEDGS